MTVAASQVAVKVQSDAAPMSQERSRRTMIDYYLTEKITSHITLILDEYISNPDDIGYAVKEIIDAIKKEMVWDESRNR